jgi:hypothetical protein
MTTRLLLCALITLLIIIVLMAFALRLTMDDTVCDSECRDLRTMDRIINASAYCLANGGYQWSCWQTARDVVLR